MKKIEEFTVLKNKNGKYLKTVKENGWGVLRSTEDILKADHYGSANSAAYNIGALSYTPVRVQITYEIKELYEEKFGTRKEIGWDD
jgi:hypothetical protein